MNKLLLVAVLLLAGCSRGSGEPPPPAQGNSDPKSGTPVQMDLVAIDTVQVTVQGPGRTESVRLASIRAPFAGTLASLTVTDGDPVHAGQQIASLVSRTSEAELAGAQAMLDAARTPEAKADAERALALARGDLVQVPVTSPETGTVVTHAVTDGDRVAEGEEILSLAVSGSVVFVARITQHDMAGVAPGQDAAIRLASGRNLSGVVHGILPAVDGESPSVAVRIDLGGADAPAQIGLQGVATINVEVRQGVLTVPEAAVLTDDIHGTRRVATVTPQGTVRWVDVETGRSGGGRVEILSPPLEPGQTVVVSGQVGLPDGSPVRAGS